MVSIRISVTVPKTAFKDKGWVEGVRRALITKSAPTMKSLFRKSTVGWSRRPSFGQSLTQQSSKIAMEVYTNDRLYALINEGAPRHDIPAKPGGWLRFRSGYRSSTTPGQLQSRRACRSGPYWKARIITDHPGFEPRKFDELVAEEYGPQFINDMQDALNDVARSSGG